MAARGPGADGCIGGQAGGRGGVGVDAVVQVPQSAQLGLKQDVLAVALGLAQERAGVADIGQQLLAPGAQPLHHIGKLVALCAVDLFDGQVFPFQDPGQTLFQLVHMAQLAHHDRLLLVFIGVDRRNAAAGGAVLGVPQALFLQAVLRLVEGEDNGRPVGDAEVFRRDGDPSVHQGLHFTPEVLQVDDDTVAQNIHNALGENAGGDQMQGKLAVLIDDGVPSVVAALVAADNIIVFGDEIDHAALSFVTPVDAYDCAVGHNNSSFKYITEIQK